MLAARSNNLADDRLQPWHLKAAVTLFDDNGKEGDKGVIEEFWASEHKYKLLFKTAGFSQMNYEVESGTMRVGERAAPPVLLTLAAHEFIEPINGNQELIDHWSLNKERREINGLKLVCLSVNGIAAGGMVRPMIGPVYCLDDDRPVIRASLQQPGPVEFNRNDIRNFEGQFVPAEINAFRSGKLALSARLETLETMKAMNEADFIPPSDAFAVPKKVAISAGVAAVMLAHETAPEYPSAAIAARVAGVVTLGASIGKDGKVLDLKVISGPPLLQQAALDAVRTWVYKPYLLNGEPVEVMTTINVVFSLAR